MQQASHRQHATGNMDRATRSRERGAAGCVEHETCSMHTLRERCNLQQPDPYRLQHAGMRACRSMLRLHAACCPVHATRTVACNPHRAACTIRLRRARDIQHEKHNNTIMVTVCSSMQRATALCHKQDATCKMQPTKCGGDMQHATHDMQPATRDMQPATRNMQRRAAWLTRRA